MKADLFRWGLLPRPSLRLMAAPRRVKRLARRWRETKGQLLAVSFWLLAIAKGPLERAAFCFELRHVGLAGRLMARTPTHSHKTRMSGAPGFDSFRRSLGGYK